jgi:hypothetical protein
MTDYKARLRRQLGGFITKGDVPKLRGVDWSADSHICGHCGL